MNKTIDELESGVRSYCRMFPTVFAKARGAELFDQSGRRYLDFFAGAGTLNYGHNPEPLKERLLEYIAQDGIAHGLDMATEAKVAFLDAFERHILEPRELEYRVMFPGPTGTNAVEAAIKLARKVTGRSNVIAFTNAFHGMTLGALALTGNSSKRRGAGTALHNVTHMPYCGYLEGEADSIDILETYLSDPSSGVDAPAAFVVETVQGEGGINVASHRWMERLDRLCRKHGSLLIIDDIQMGCGRTGRFFSFEHMDVRPNIVCLSKSISGYGLPMALTLFDPELDVWKPGEHNGTFRGNNLAFVTATAALEKYWDGTKWIDGLGPLSAHVRSRLEAAAQRFGAELRGRGFVWGLSFEDKTVATRAAKHAFERGLIVETAGSHDEVLKFLAPLTTTRAQLNEGLDIMEEALGAAVDETKGRARSASRSSVPAAQPEVSA